MHGPGCVLRRHPDGDVRFGAPAREFTRFADGAGIVLPGIHRLEAPLGNVKLALGVRTPAMNLAGHPQGAAMSASNGH